MTVPNRSEETVQVCCAHCKFIHVRFTNAYGSLGRELLYGRGSEGGGKIRQKLGATGGAKLVGAQIVLESKNEAVNGFALRKMLWFLRRFLR